MDRHLLALALVFAPLSLVAVGGGQTVVAGIHHQVVDLHGWLTPQDFVTDFAVSRMAPGPGSLLATLIGWQVGGLLGAIVATLAIFGPTTLLMTGVAVVWRRGGGGARWQRALEAGLRPVAAGLILAAVLVLLQSLSGGLAAVAVAIASTACLLVTRVNPLLLLGAGAGVFVVLHGARLV